MQTLLTRLSTYQQALQQLRADPSQLAAYRYQASSTAEGWHYDAHATARYRLLLALLMDRHADDGWILEALMQAEIKAHRAEAFQGLSNAMRLNAYLLASLNQPAHLRHFIKAKNANFDTGFEFNERFFLWHGITASYAAATQLGKKSQRVFYAALGDTPSQCRYSDADIQAWKTRLDQYYANYLSRDHFEEEFHLLLDVDEHSLAASVLQQWQLQQSPHDRAYWHRLAQYQNYLGDTGAEIVALQHKLALANGRQEFLHDTIALGGLYVQQQDRAGLEACLATYWSVPNKVKKLRPWSSNQIENQCLAFILLQNDMRNAQAIKAWQWLKPQLKQQNGMGASKLEAIAQVYALLGKRKKSARYRVLAQQVQQQFSGK